MCALCAARRQTRRPRSAAAAGAVLFGHGISFSYNDQASDNSSNESLTVEADDQGLFLKALGIARVGTGSDRDRHLTFEGAAEDHWSLFIEPLQRRR